MRVNGLWTWLDSLHRYLGKQARERRKRANELRHAMEHDATHVVSDPDFPILGPIPRTTCRRSSRAPELGISW